MLRKVVEEYLEGGAPVGSKALSVDVQWGPSTIRNELASLEELGLLAHPHTSAGRIPTEAGYRYFVDRLLPARGPEPAHRGCRCRSCAASSTRRCGSPPRRSPRSPTCWRSSPRRRSRPRPSGTSRCSLLQPQVLMVVVITSTGGVTKRMFTFAAPVDPGLADWAASYLNERLVGLGLGARMLQKRLHDPSLSRSESDFLEALSPVFTELEEGAHDSLYVEGTSRLLRDDASGRGVGAERADGHARAPGDAARGAPGGARPSATCWSGSAPRTQAPGLRSLALVAAGYGLPQRRLGTVSVIGPLRMDYGRRSTPCATRPRSSRASSPRSTTSDEQHARLLRGAGRPARRRRRHDQEGLPAAGPRAAPGRQQARSRRRGQVQGGGRGLRGPVGLRAPRHLRPLRARGAAQRRLRAELRRVRVGVGHLRGVLRRRRRSVRRPVRDGRRGARRRGDPGRRRRGRRPRSTWPRRLRARRSRSATRRWRCASTATATGPSLARRSRPARAARGAVSCGRCRARRSARSCGPRCATCAMATGGWPASRARCAGARARGRAPQGQGRRAGRDRRRPADPDRGARPRRRARRPARRPVRADPRARGPALRPRRRRPDHRRRRLRAAGRARDHGRGSNRARRARSRSRFRPGPSRTRR